MCQHVTFARIAEGLAVSSNTSNDAGLAEGKRVLISDPSRFDGHRSLNVTSTCSVGPATASYDYVSGGASASVGRRCRLVTAAQLREAAMALALSTNAIPFIRAFMAAAPAPGNPPGQSSHGPTLSAGAIVGIVIAVLVIGVVVTMFLLRSRR